MTDTDAEDSRRRPPGRSASAVARPGPARPPPAAARHFPGSSSPWLPADRVLTAPGSRATPDGSERLPVRPRAPRPAVSPCNGPAGQDRCAPGRPVCSGARCPPADDGLLRTPTSLPGQERVSDPDWRDCAVPAVPLPVRSTASRLVSRVPACAGVGNSGQAPGRFLEDATRLGGSGGTGLPGVRRCPLSIGSGSAQATLPVRRRGKASAYGAHAPRSLDAISCGGSAGSRSRLKCEQGGGPVLVRLEAVPAEDPATQSRSPYERVGPVHPSCDVLSDRLPEALRFRPSSAARQPRRGPGADRMSVRATGACR